MSLGDYRKPQNTAGLDEEPGTITARQLRAIARLSKALPEEVFSLYCLAVGAGLVERVPTLSEFAAGLLIEGLQSGDPCAVAVNRPMAGTVGSLLEYNGYNKTAPSSVPVSVAAGGNLGHDGGTEPGQWVKTMRAALNKRAEAKKPVWQCSLRNTANDRVLTDAEWADAGQDFAEVMGFENHPWVMVRHGEDHVHLVVARVDFEGQLWSRSHDRRKAQRAASCLEDTYGLEKAPRTVQKGTQRLSASEIHQMAQDRQKMLAGHRRRAQEPAAEPTTPDIDTGMSAEEIAEMRELTGHDFLTKSQPSRKTPEKQRLGPSTKPDGEARNTALENAASSARRGTVCLLLGQGYND